MSERWPWGFSVYGGGAALDSAITAQLNGLARHITSRYVSGTAQLDQQGGATVRMVLDPLGRFAPTYLPNVNTGTPASMVDFTRWSHDTCAADHHALVLSGHGVAWQDSVADQLVTTRLPIPLGARRNARSVFSSRRLKEIETRAIMLDADSQDFLSNLELRQALDAVGNTSVLVLDACLMSSVELAVELKGCASHLVATIDELSSAGLDHAAVARMLNERQGRANAREVAAAYVNSFVPRTVFDTAVAIDLDATRLEEAKRRFGKLVQTLSLPNDAESLKSVLQRATSSIVKYVSGGLADAGALFDAFTRVGGFDSQAIAAARAAFEALVVSKKSGTAYAAALGLSVFSPANALQWKKVRRDYALLTFSEDTGWAALLEALWA